MLYKSFLQSSATVKEQVAQDKRMLNTLATKYKAEEVKRWSQLKALHDKAKADGVEEQLLADLKDCFVFYDFGMQNNPNKTDFNTFLQSSQFYMDAGSNLSGLQIAEQFQRDMADLDKSLVHRWERASKEGTGSLLALRLKLKIEFAQCKDAYDNSKAQVYTKFFDSQGMLEEALNYQNNVNLHKRWDPAIGERKGDNQLITIDPTLVKEFWGRVSRDDVLGARDYGLFFESKGRLEEALVNPNAKQAGSFLLGCKMLLAMNELTQTREESEALLRTQISSLLNQNNLKYLSQPVSKQEERIKLRFLAYTAVTPVSKGAISNHDAIRLGLLKDIQDTTLAVEQRRSAADHLKLFNAMIFLGQKGYSRTEIEMYFDPELGQLPVTKEAMERSLLDRDKIFAAISMMTFNMAAMLPAVMTLKADNSLSDSFRVGLCASGLLLVHAFASTNGNAIAKMITQTLKKHLPEMKQAVQKHYALAIPAFVGLLRTDSLLTATAIGLCTALLVKAPELIARFAPVFTARITANYNKVLGDFKAQFPRLVEKMPTFSKEHYGLAVSAILTLTCSGSMLLTTAIALCTGGYVIASNFAPGLCAKYSEPLQRYSALAGKALETVKEHIAELAVPTLITYAVSNSILASASATVGSAILFIAGDYLRAKGDINYKAVADKLKELSTSQESFVTRLQNGYDTACENLAVAFS